METHYIRPNSPALGFKAFQQPTSQDNTRQNSFGLATNQGVGSSNLSGRAKFQNVKSQI